MSEPTQIKTFTERAHKGLTDLPLQKNLTVFRNLAPPARKKAVERIDDIDLLRHWVKTEKDKTLNNLGFYLEQFESNVKKMGGHVHWASTPDDVNTIVTTLCHQAAVKKIVKGKSMVSEETGLLQALEKEGFDTIETDLGEYIIQLAEEPPSHIIGPAIHKNFDQVVELFKTHHDFGSRELNNPKEVMAEARQVLRHRFLEADVGITGANYLIADTGSIGLVTNEGNGDLCASLPDTHIVVTSIDKIVPHADLAMGIQRLLVPSATAQDITCYTTFITGAKDSNDDAGPTNFHVVLLDNKRSDILHSEYRDILRCIRCSACLNHCPVYTRTGGHAYDSVYPGPMGSVWSPLLNGLEEKHELPNACTTCGRCTEVCPMEIPLADMLRQLRKDEQTHGLQPARWVFGMKIYSWLIKHPSLYRLITQLGIKCLHRFSRKNGSIKNMGFNNGWTEVRNFPAPESSTFMSQFAKRVKQRSGDE